MVLLFDFIHRQFLFEPPVPTTSFDGKTVIVTGGNTGLGKEACIWLIRLGASRVIIACRNLVKGEAAAKDIQEATSCEAKALLVWQLDLSSYASVQAFARKAKDELPRLDAVLANAGLATTKFRMTEDNEEQITTNVVSTALLAFLLHPTLGETAVKFKTQTHLTVTGSELYEIAKLKELKGPADKLFDNLNDKKVANMFDRYNVSKLLQIYIVKEIAKSSPVESSGVIVNIVAPGMCYSELHREISSAAINRLMKLLGRTCEVGSRTLVHGAGVGPESHGKYVPDTKITALKGLDSGKQGAGVQEKFWEELKVKLELIQPGVTSLA